MKHLGRSADRFRVVIASDDDHEKVYAEIYCDDKFVALISQDHGPDLKMLEVPGQGFVEEEISRKVELDGFRKALELAERKLDGE